MMMGDEDVIPDLIVVVVVVVVCNSSGSGAVGVVTGGNYKKMTAEEGNISCDPVITV